MTYYNEAKDTLINTAIAQAKVTSDSVQGEVARATSAPDISTPSISSSAMLVEHTCSKWMGRKKDKDASAKVVADNIAEPDTASVNKVLLGDSPTLKAIHSLAANARNLHYAMTLPWNDMGHRMLPTETYFKYHELMTDIQGEFDRLVEEFLATYDWEVSMAQARLGTLFVRNDYPTTASLSDKFAFRMSYFAISDPQDFRIKVGQEQEQVLKDHMNEYHNARFNGAMNHMWKRVHDVASNMSVRLRVAGENDKVSKTGALPLHDSMVDHALDIIELLGACNVTGDSQQEAIRRRFEDALHGVTTDGLRNSATLRAETKASIDNIILNLPSLDL